MKLLPRLALAAALVAPIAALAGPISKWDDRQPELEFSTAAKLYDIERCILNMDGWPMPMVYRQPDRPDRVILMYQDQNGFAAGRIDLHQDGAQVHVRAWKAGKQLLECAPPVG